MSWTLASALFQAHAELPRKPLTSKKTLSQQQRQSMAMAVMQLLTTCVLPIALLVHVCSVPLCTGNISAHYAQSTTH